MNQEILKRYIKGYAADAEKVQVTEWAKVDERNMKELLALRRLYDITLWKENNKHPDQHKKTIRITFYRIGVVAAVFLFLIVTNWYTYNLREKMPDVIMQTIRVPAGQRVELTLTDGTNVWLNAGSTFIYPNNFEADKREVTLNGEGYFNVATDKQKPFIVKTSFRNIEAVGTEFNVLAYQKSPLFEVSLLEGEVNVGESGKQVKLQPDEKLFLSDGRLMKERIHNYDYLLWKNGLICFDDETMDSMVEKLELYFDTKVIVENTSFMKRKYTGKFRTKDGLEHILKVFQLKDSFIYERDEENNRFIIK
ncbi:MAG: FecR family protein [Tannerella sp.]|jgi:ferric-dicitrate binding protein FerR (iron transport regulator)|nr:FecR family protein [Tannerella sp.]